MCLRNTLDAASKTSGCRPDLLHFLPKGKKIMVSNPSSRVRADVHRTSAFDLSNLVGSISPSKKDILVDVLLFVSLQHFRCTFFGLFSGSKKQKKSKKTFRKFRHVTGLFPAAMQAASPCFQKTIEYSLSVLLPESVSLFAQTSG